MALMLTCVLIWLGRRVAARAICSSFKIGLDPVLLLFLPLLTLLAAILDWSVTTTLILPYRVCYIIMHLVHLSLTLLCFKEPGAERVISLSSNMADFLPCDDC